MSSDHPGRESVSAEDEKDISDIATTDDESEHGDGESHPAATGSHDYQHSEPVMYDVRDTCCTKLCRFVCPTWGGSTASRGRPSTQIEQFHLM